MGSSLKSPANTALQSDGRVGRFAPSRVRRRTPVSLDARMVPISRGFDGDAPALPYSVESGGRPASIARLEIGRFHLYRTGDLTHLLPTPSAILVSRDLAALLTSQTPAGCRVREVTILDPPNGEVAGYVELLIDAELERASPPPDVSGKQVWHYGPNHLFVSPELAEIISARFPDLVLSRGFSRFAGYDGYGVDRPSSLDRDPSTNDPEYLQSLAACCNATTELLVLFRYRAAAGSRDYELHSSLDSLLGRIRRLPPGTAVAVFKQPQLPIRGVVDDAFVTRCLGTIRDGAEYLLLETVVTVAGKLSWFRHGGGESHAELRDDLAESRGKPVAVGLYHPWPGTPSDSVHAVVPDPDGVVRPGPY